MRLRRFITAFVCLSTLAFAQNVVAGTSASDSSSAVIQADLPSQPSLKSGGVGAAMPAPSTMMLFVCGLAGLTAAGGRRPESEEELA